MNVDISMNKDQRRGTLLFAGLIGLFITYAIRGGWPSHVVGALVASVVVFGMRFAFDLGFQRAARIVQEKGKRADVNVKDPP